MEGSFLLQARTTVVVGGGRGGPAGYCIKTEGIAVIAGVGELEGSRQDVEGGGGAGEGSDSGYLGKRGAGWAVDTVVVQCCRL